ncbi:MAG TPA: ATP-binding cassette domain-containing protein [Vicinamibacterales bacterium]|nr:ATP-binding cassette domain-containing protein [Vicinamibacterales bacterium]
MPPTAAAAELKQLSKSFRVRRTRGTGVGARLRELFSRDTQTVAAVDRLSFSIAPGERVAFIGPNGAGKSTTLKMLAGILQPDAGDVRVLGLVPSRQRRQLAFQIGTVFGQRSQLWYQLPPRDTFELLGRVYEIEPRAHRRRIDTLSSVFALGTLVNTPVRHLSLGERMRCEIVVSLLHSPRMLFLDEPTIGLDVSAKAMIRELLWTESERDRVTLLLTSHDTGDMERVCSRAIVINHGRLMWDGPISALRRTYLKAKRVTLWSEAERLELMLPGVRVLSSGSYRTELEIALEITPLGQVVDAALRQAAIRDMAIEDAPLDEVIRALYAASPPGGVSS